MLKLRIPVYAFLPGAGMRTAKLAKLYTIFLRSHVNPCTKFRSQSVSLSSIPQGIWEVHLS